MKIQITGKQVRVTEEVKDWVERKVSRLDRYSPRIVESHVILKKEKYLYVAEVTLQASGLYAFGEGRHKTNLFTAIDTASDRVAAQLRRFRDKLKGHHGLQRKRVFRTKRTTQTTREELAG